MEQGRRKQRTTDAILDAAERLLAERGWAATTIQAIAAEAGVAIGSIYARFAGKEALHLALVDRLLALNERSHGAALAGPGSPLRRAIAAGDAYLAFHREHPSAFRLIGLRDLERGADHAELRASIAARLDAMVRALAATLDEAAAAGETPPLDALATARFLWGAWNGSIQLLARGALDARELDAVIGAGRFVLERGLRG